MKLQKCPTCKTYTLKEECKCGEKTKSAHYKFVKVRDAPGNFKRKQSRLK